jgi:hypothetical protein
LQVEGERRFDVSDLHPNVIDHGSKE